jgi:two-component system chemotaxis response regulator CheY
MKHLLIVDDSPVILTSIGAILQKAGYDVRQAADGPDALSWLERETFDLVMVDLHMPGMDGVELIRRIRALPDHRFTPILVLTAETRRAPRQQARDAGATVWMTKPVTPGQLLQALEHVGARVSDGTALRSCHV